MERGGDGAPAATCTADGRLTSRRHGAMQQINVLAMDDIIQGDAYTSSRYSDILGQCDQLKFMVVVNQTGTISASHAKVYIEHSGDGINWLDKIGSPACNIALSTGPAMYLGTG